MPYEMRRPRNWDLPTISRGRDTRDEVPPGHHGNRGSLTFSFPIKLAQNFLAKFCSGQPFAHVKIERHDDTSILIAKSALTEYGRKFSKGGIHTKDYRVFFDAAAYAWIDNIEPFGATETTATLTNEGILIVVPPVEKREPLMPVHYKTRRLQYQREHALTTVRPVEVIPPEGKMFLVMVPVDKIDQFHTLLRFLKLEALEE